MSGADVNSASELRRLFPGASGMAARMRAFDWSQTDLGPPETWPQNLRVALSLCLTSRFPILIWWGTNLTMLYNDAYIPFLGEAKHPRALGLPGRECWGEIWDLIGPMLEGVRATGEATWSDDFLCFFARKLPREEVHVRFTYGPILSTDGRTVEGIFTPCTEITEEVISARRLEALRKLGAKAAEARTAATACQEAAVILAQHPHDIPFAAIYLVDEQAEHATLAATAGLPEGAYPLPPSVSLASDDSSLWPLASVLRTRRSEAVAFGALGLELPGSPWSEPASTALLLPITVAAQPNLAGLLVAGVSPHRPLDATYHTFLDLVAGQIGAAITGAHAYEEERQRAEVLAELDRAKTAFFNNISHEFRTPLMLLLAPAEDALADPAFPSDKRERIVLIHRNALRLQKLVNTLLDFSRIEAHRIEATYVATDLATLTAELASMFRSAVERAGLRLTIDCPPLPEPAYVDRDMWEKIVFNLLSNALKFTFTGEIVVSLQPRESAIDLTVRDTGTGIPAAELPQLFQRFHRISGAHGRSFEGSGIGLALVQELVRLHGGTIQVASVVDQGSVFTVTIPQGIRHLPPDRIASPDVLAPISLPGNPYVDELLGWLPGEITETPPPLTNQSTPSRYEISPHSGATSPRPRILLADDNVDMRLYIQRLLSSQYTIEAVADGAAALAAVRDRPPDLILADVMMPQLDGFGLIQELRSDPRMRTIPIILLSARAGEEARVEGLAAGADDYLIKPFGARELLVRVNGTLALAKVRREAVEALTAREIQLREAQHLAQIGSWEWNPATDTVTWSDELYRIWGVNPQAFEATYAAVHELVHPNDRAFFEQQIATALRTYAPCSFEHRIIRPDGELRIMHSRGAVVVSDGGEVARMVGTAQDITERKQTEAELEATRLLFQRIAETSPDMLYVYDLIAGRTVYISARSEQVIGYTPDQLSALDDQFALTLLHADDLAAVPKHHRTLRKLDDNDIYEIECRLRQPDGSYRWLRSRFSVFTRAENGHVQQLIGITQDVTERKQAEADLVELKNRLASDLATMTNLHQLGAQLLTTSELEALLSEALSAIIALQGANFGNIQLYNQQRGSLEIIVQQGFDRAFLEHFSTVDDEHSASGRAMLWGGRVIIEDVETDPGFAPHRAIAAATGFRAVQSTPLYDRAGTLLGVVSTHFRQPHRPTEHMLRLTDLYTRQIAEIIGFKQAQEQLRQAHDELEAKVEARTQQLADANAALVVENDERRRAEQARRLLIQQFVSAQEEERRRISRELHDSLGQYLTALNMGLKSMEDQTGLTDRTASGIRQMQHLVALLDDAVARIAFELRPPRLDDLGLDAALHLLAKEWSATSGIHVDIVTNGLSRQRIPATTETTLYRVVQEALTNILKHAQASRVSLIAERRNGEVRVIIEDDGRGFDLAAVVAAPEAQRKLGLRGMEERAALAGGRIEIETAPGKGTTIYIYLPLPLEQEGGTEHG